jgi:hypothetical protein
MVNNFILAECVWRVSLSRKPQGSQIVRWESNDHCFDDWEWTNPRSNDSLPALTDSPRRRQQVWKAKGIHSRSKERLVDRRQPISGTRGVDLLRCYRARWTPEKRTCIAVIEFDGLVRIKGLASPWSSSVYFRELGDSSVEYDTKH